MAAAKLVPPAMVGDDGQKTEGQKKNEIKCVVIGDAAVGKTCMLISYTTNQFPSEYTPTVFDNYTTKVTVDGKVFLFHLWDTAGSEHFDLLRPLSYTGTNVFVICYAIVDRTSYINVKDKWVRDLKEKAGHIPFLIAATKADLRDVGEKKDLITAKEGQDLAKDVGAKYFIECSSITQAGLKECFNQAITIALSGRADEEEVARGGCGCVLM